MTEEQVVGIYVMPTVPGRPPRALLFEGEATDGLIAREQVRAIVEWSRDMGCWVTDSPLGHVPVDEELDTAITDHARDLGVEW